MLVNRHLNGMSCMFLSKGQLHSVTQKVFGRQCGPKEEFNRLNLSVGLSTSRHNLIPRLHLIPSCDLTLHSEMGEKHHGTQPLFVLSQVAECLAKDLN
jgi:hypothetical protein